MSVELFNACAYLVDRQVEAGLGGHLAVTGPAGSAAGRDLTALHDAVRRGHHRRATRPGWRTTPVARCPTASREGLASFKRPREVLTLDGLPKTATGKIQRNVVREIVSAKLGK